MLRELRSGGCCTPVLLLTAKAEVEDRILGLDMGADDYLPKPFAMGELLARVRAMLRRGEVYTPDVLSFGDLELDRGGSLLSSVSGSVTLTRLEYRMLEALMLNRGIYLSTEELLVKVWGYESEAEQEAVQYAQEAAASGENTGREGRFKYRIAPSRDGRGSLVVFLDVSEDTRSMLTVAVLSLLAGAGCWLAAFLAVMLLSKRAISPIVESMARQKQFITDAGHEIKTPLAIIRANADALELHEGESRWSRNIRSQTERLDELTKRLLTLARLDEGGAARPEAAELELSQLIEDAAAQFAGPAEAAGLGLKTEIEPGLKLRGVPETVTELAGILLDNAVKYSAPSSVISLRLVREGGRSVLRVRNRCEERPREPERLFDRFYRGDAARTQSSGGSGLGLAIARALAENLHGSLIVETPGETDLEFVARFP